MRQRGKAKGRFTLGEEQPGRVGEGDWLQPRSPCCRAAPEDACDVSPRGFLPLQKLQTRSQQLMAVGSRRKRSESPLPGGETPVFLTLPLTRGGSGVGICSPVPHPIQGGSMGVQISDGKQKLAAAFRHKIEQFSPKATEGGAQTLQPPVQNPNNPPNPGPETPTVHN